MQFVDEATRHIQSVIEQRFLFRKLGLPFDYAAPQEEFPAKTLATAKEARGNIPNPLGLGSGYFHSCQNHALLFDSYLLRVELGIEDGNDEQILDRLIGGLIRIATVAPKSFLIGGLAPDGRGFYAWTSRENHAAWAFAVSRGLQTAAISPESQEKFRSIVGKWYDRLQRDNFVVTTVDSRPLPDGDLAAANPLLGPCHLAVQLIAALASDNPERQDAYEAAAEENERVRLAPLGGADDAAGQFGRLWRQACLTVIAERDYNPERAALAKERRRENALAVADQIVRWRDWDKSLVDEAVDWDWRKFPKADPAESNGLGFAPPPSWQRLQNEEPLRQALNAMAIMLLANDPDLASPHAAEIEECLVTTPWDKVVRLTALAPAVGIHARGVEMGLWDKTLFEARHDFSFAEESLAAKYLEPDYDSANPDQAGHRSPPPGKNPEPAAGRGEGGKKRKRRRRR